MTKQEQPTGAQRALERLQQRWLAIRPILSECRNDWDPQLDTVTASIDRAAADVSAQKLPAAHEELEAIRELFMSLRQQAGIPYELDSLNAFHVIMEQIVKPATTMTAADLNDAARSRFFELSQEASSAWRQVAQTQFDAQRFHLDSAGQAKLQDLLDAETQRLAAFEEALQGNASEDILVTARELKPGFAAVFMFFGEPLPQR